MGNPNECAEKLIDLLIAAGKHKATAKKFVKIRDDQKMLLLENLLEDHKLIPDLDEHKLKKNLDLSQYFRLAGNDSYKKKNFMESLERYNKCLCAAPSNSADVGLAYGNRSAVYLEMGYYQKALDNIELARNHNYPSEKLEKLKAREDQCLKKLNNEPPKDRYQEHEKIRNEIFRGKLPGNKKTPFYVADCLELKRSPKWGRHIVTNRDLKVGTIIAIEEPFSMSAASTNRFQRCENCLIKNLLNLIPCDFCCNTMFCSEKCKKIAWKKFHQFECGIVEILDTMFPNTAQNGLRNFFEAWSLFNQDSVALNDFLQKIEDSDTTIFDLDFSHLSEIEKMRSLFHCINSLEKLNRDTVEMFNESITFAILSNFMLNHTLLGSVLNFDAKAMFRKFLFRHLQIAANNTSGINGATEETLKDRQPDNPNEIANCREDFGAGVYPFCSLMNHSCIANVNRINYQVKNYLIVQTPIKAGEQLFNDYGYQFQFYPYEKRKMNLFHHHNKLVCSCAACLSPALFPLKDDLPIKDIRFLFLIKNDVELMKIGDLKWAEKSYERYCQYIEKNYGKNFPCVDIAILQDAVSKCLRVFTLSENW